MNTPPEVKLEVQDAIINHLSNEIQTATNAMNEFRLRGNFTIFFAPFIALGTYLIYAEGSASQPNFDLFHILLALLAILIWLFLGFISYSIEKHTWDKCNFWRQCISRIQSGQLKEIYADDLIFRHNLLLGYSLFYLLQGAMFVDIAILVLTL